MTPLLPTTSFTECGHPGTRLPLSAVPGLDHGAAGPLPTAEAVAPALTTCKLCLLPPVLAESGVHLRPGPFSAHPSPASPLARQHPRQSVPLRGSNDRPSPGLGGRPAARTPSPASTCGPARPGLLVPKSPHSPRIGLFRHGAASRGLRGSLGRRQRARPGAPAARSFTRSHGGQAVGLRQTPTGPAPWAPERARAPGSALGLVSRGGGGGSAAAPNPTWRRRRRGEQGPRNGGSGPRSVRAGPRERRARAAAAAAGGHGRRRRRQRRQQRLRGALGGEARPLEAHPPAEGGGSERAGGGEPGPLVTCPKHAHVTPAPRPLARAAHARSAQPRSARGYG